jgi:hypothetical protein
MSAINKFVTNSLLYDSAHYLFFCLKNNQASLSYTINIKFSYIQLFIRKPVNKSSLFSVTRFVIYQIDLSLFMKSWKRKEYCSK